MTTGDASTASRLGLYRDMVRARKMEEAILELFKGGDIPGSTHLGLGQEAIPIGVVSCLDEGDQVVGTYRGHSLALAKKIAMGAIMSEVMGKATGTNQGYGGSMHITSRKHGLIGNFSIVGAGIPVAVGLGLGSRLKSEPRVTACFFGDGATNIGYFSESLNMAALLRTPVLFAVENNLYGEYSPIATTSKVTDLATKARALGVKAAVADGNDVDDVVAATKGAVEEIRRTSEPCLIEFKTYRRTGHSRLDDGTSYQPAAEREQWYARDPLAICRSRLMTKGSLTETEDAAILKSVDREVRQATEFAKRSPYPETSGMKDMVFCQSSEDPTGPTPKGEGAESTMRYAIRSALALGMERDPTVLLFGEDVAKAGGVFKVTEGLLERFGPQRVWNTPISENSMAGMALGLAVSGFHPVLEIMFSDFLLMAMDGLGNEAAKMRWTSGGQHCVPLVVRTACGGGMGWASHHSQTLDSLLLSTPGIKIVTPSNAYDAKGLLLSALRDPNPVVFFEHKSLYASTRSTPAGYYTVPLGKAKVVREGEDLTLVSNMRMVQRCLESAEALLAENISAEVIDLMTVCPMDVDTVLASVGKTHSLVVVEESPIEGGWGNSLIASLMEKGLYHLERPPLRIGIGGLPLPFSPALEKEVIPDAGAITGKIRSLMKSG